MLRMHEQHELVAADGNLEQPRFRRMERQRAEVEAALLHLDGDLPRRHAADVDRDVREALAEPPDERQQRVHGGLVGADQHAPALQIAELAHRGLGFLGQPHEPLAVVVQHLAGVGQRAALRGSIEQLFAQIDFEAPDRLAHGRLRAVHLGGGAREAALLGHGEKRLQRGDIHGGIIIQSYIFVIIITLTST